MATPRKKAEDKKKPGQPTLYNKEIAEKICRAVSISTLGLRKICKLNPDFPCHDTILQWRLDHPEFSAQYADAKRHQAELLAEEILEISDDDSQDEISDERGIRVNAEFINRSRLKVDTRKWIACKLLPKIYGEKIQSESTVTIKSHEELLKELK